MDIIGFTLEVQFDKSKAFTHNAEGRRRRGRNTSEAAAEPPLVTAYAAVSAAAAREEAPRTGCCTTQGSVAPSGRSFGGARGTTPQLKDTTASVH